MASDERAEQLAGKLSLAIGQQHFLYDKHLRVVAYRHRYEMDELLCEHPDEEDVFTLVHLVWSLTSSETHRASPIVELHGCFQDFLDYEYEVQDRIMPEEVSGLSFPLTGQLNRPLSISQTEQLNSQIKEAEKQREVLGK